VGTLALATFLLPVALSILLAGAAPKRPIYVGAQVCGQCHDGEAQGNQFSLWRASKHAQAFASLARPESPKIVRLSGVPVEPEGSPICLGCHATAADTEAWEKEETFRLQDGVQCEFCHGPGSEHVADHMAAQGPASAPTAPPKPAALRVPGPEFCVTCHQEKGSHVAVLATPLLDVAEGMKSIAHPRPASAPRPELREWPTRPAPANAPASAPHYVGVEACGRCHHGPKMGYQFSLWQLSPHAQAYAVLGTQAAAEMARKDGITSDPTRTTHCMSCHATAFWTPKEQRDEGFLLEDGVQCEACHGPGSAYSPEAVMLDRQAARQAGLQEVTEETCLRCHRTAHGRPFNYQKALTAIAHPTRPAPAAAQAPEPVYKTPVNLALSPDGRELYVTCEAAGTVAVVDVAARRVVAEIASGGQPHDVCFSPDGRLAYVTNRLDDSLTVIDTAQRKVIRTIAVGDEPHGVLTSPDGKTIFVANTLSDSISVIDAETLRETTRLAASRSPWSLALSPDGKTLLVTNNLSRFVPFRAPSQSEVTAVDVARAVVRDRYVLPAANLLQGIAWHPTGEFALITMNRTKNLVPMTRLVQGWTITNGLGILWRDGRVDQVLLDEPDLCFPDVTDVAFTPDGRYALATSGGSDRVAVVDVAKLVTLLKSASDDERQHVLPNHLGKPTEFVVTHIPTGINPRGILVLPDGKTAFVADALDDSLTVIDLARLEPAGTIDLGPAGSGPKEVTKVRRGQRIFFSAAKTFHQQFSCNSCHPDGHVDGLTYDIEPDGIGIAPVDNRTLRGVLDTAPFKWEGTNPSLKRQCGPRLAVFFTRTDPFSADELDALDAYICTIPQPPNRYRGVGERLTPAQRRGKEVYERTTANDGRPIPEINRCITCHAPPYFTDRRKHDVGTRMWLDHTGAFDTPQLNNIYDSAPYLHNGTAPTLEEIWTRFNPNDKHGVTNDMTKDQLNDLIEYLRTL
jgi:YVTN family beta-propeller protein